MANEITVVYNGIIIHQTTESGSFILNTEETYMEGDVEVVVDIDELPSADGVSF